jgi:phage terminase large subunit-like protein
MRTLFRTGAEPRIHYAAYDAIAEEDEDGAWHRSLWPAKWPVESLLHRQKEIGTLQFDKNYRNRVLGDANSKFPMKWFDGGEGKFRGCFDLDGHIVDTHWTDEVRKIIAVDLASGQSEASAYFVALVVALDDRGDFHILNMVRDRLPFPDQVRTVIELHDRFYPEAVIVESNAYQQAMVDAIPAQAPRVPVLPHMTWLQHHDPEHGVMMLQPLIEAGRIRFPMGDPTSQALSEIIISELNRFGVAKFKDTVMALWFAVSRLVSEETGEGLMEARIL